jgi:excisionase family DNA binding protein
MSLIGSDLIGFKSGLGRPLRHGDPEVENTWLTANEAAQYLKVKPRTLLLWARQGKVPAHRLSGIQRCIYRFLGRELDLMLGVSSAEPADGRQQ